MTTTTLFSSARDQATPRFSLDGVPPCLPPQAGPRKSVLMRKVSRADSHDQTCEALDKALQRPTWTQDTPFEPSRTQGKAVTGFTSLAAIVGAVVTASVAASPWAVFFTKH